MGGGGFTDVYDIVYVFVYIIAELKATPVKIRIL